MLPAYVPNPVAVVAGGGRAIDGGRYWTDGRRIFGEGKTYRGLFIGIFSGVLVGGLLIAVQNAIPWEGYPVQTPLSVMLLASGALLGDLAKSFFKRRLGMKRGDAWLIADQYDLVAGAFVLLLIFDPAWILGVMTIPIFLIIIIVTPLLHRATNIIGYIIGVKDVPW